MRFANYKQRTPTFFTQLKCIYKKKNKDLWHTFAFVETFQPFLILGGLIDMLTSLKDQGRTDLKNDDVMYRVFLFGICIVSAHYFLPHVQDRQNKLRKVFNQAGMGSLAYTLGIFFCDYIFAYVQIMLFVGLFWIGGYRHIDGWVDFWKLVNVMVGFFLALIAYCNLFGFWANSVTNVVKNKPTILFFLGSITSTEAQGQYLFSRINPVYTCFVSIADMVEGNSF